MACLCGFDWIDPDAPTQFRRAMWQADVAMRKAKAEEAAKAGFAGRRQGR
jgi:hypothetical protein